MRQACRTDQAGLRLSSISPFGRGPADEAHTAAGSAFVNPGIRPERRPRRSGTPRPPGHTPGGGNRKISSRACTRTHRTKATRTGPPTAPARGRRLGNRASGRRDPAKALDRRRLGIPRVRADTAPIEARNSPYSDIDDRLAVSFHGRSRHRALRAPRSPQDRAPGVATAGEGSESRPPCASPCAVASCIMASANVADAL